MLRNKTDQLSLHIYFQFLEMETLKNEHEKKLNEQRQLIEVSFCALLDISGQCACCYTAIPAQMCGGPVEDIGK